MKKLIYLFVCLTWVNLSVDAKAKITEPVRTKDVQNIAICNSESTIQKTSATPFPEQISSFFNGILDTSQWPARWYCGNWTNVHGWVYIISDFTIWFAYFMIPLVLGYFVLKRKRSLPFKSIIILFIAFILACGLTHLIDAIIFWWPAYKLSAILRLGTALVSGGTVIALFKVIPQAMKFRSPDELQVEINQRIDAEKALAKKIVELEEINEMIINRELKMVDLKNQIKKLQAK